MKYFATVQEWKEARIRRAITSADSGKGVSNEDVLEWVKSWDTENEQPKPVALGRRSESG